MSRDRLFWIVMALIGGALIVLVVNHDDGRTFGLANDDFGSLVFLGLWGTVIAVGILASRARLAASVRALAVWLVIVLVLVAGYQARYELQDVASRVTAGLIPGSPLSRADAEGRATVTLEKLANGHFEVRLGIEGATIRAIVDTGATTTVLTSADAEAAGHDPESLNFVIPVSTANGMGRAARITAREIAIGDIVRHDLSVLVAERGALDQSLLGMNFIASLSGFDIRGDRMILRD